MNKTLNVIEIIRGTTVDGPGFRTSIYLAGCTHRCFGCHNPQSWTSDAGIPMTIGEILEIVNEEDFDVTLSGGDPLFDPGATSELVKALKENRHNVWIYTGYTWEVIIESTDLFKAVEMADVVVDGPFILDLKDLDLPFRGSSNQRIIDVKASLEYGRPVLVDKY